MFLPTFIKLAENGVNMMSRPATSAAKLDEAYYDTKTLTKGERQQAMALLAEQNVPEGSIFVISSDDSGSFDLVPDPDKEGEKRDINWGALRSRERGELVVKEFLERSDWANVETVVIPGCGSSTLGAAALGKSVAHIQETVEGSKQTVAAIVAGQGAFDQWLEAASGGVIMTPMANLLNAIDPILEFTAKANPVVAEIYINDLIDAIHEAGTLYALLKARLVEGTLNKLNMIVSHSKANWAVLVALLAFELELPELERLGKLRDPGQRIAVVTFGNPVNLPDMSPTMKRLFHYHQFVGAVDKLAFNCSMKAWKLKLSNDEKLDPQDPVFDPEADPNELMLADTEHHLFAKRAPESDEELKPFHMPIERILPQLRRH